MQISPSRSPCRWFVSIRKEHSGRQSKLVAMALRTMQPQSCSFLFARRYPQIEVDVTTLPIKAITGIPGRSDVLQLGHVSNS